MSRPRDYRDICIEQLVEENTGLADQIKTLAERAVIGEADRDAFRRVAVQGLHHAHDLHVHNLRLEEQLARLRQENRELRTLRMGEAIAA